MPKKVVTEKQLIDAMEKYLYQLRDDPKVSDTKLRHMQTALYGAKCIIRDAFGSKSVMECSIV